MLHGLLTTWFHWVESWGYWGVFLLMAMESSIFPVPSEIVMPPAAFWAAQGKMSFWGVVAAGTAGSYVGAAATYWGARILGIPFVRRYGKYFFIPEHKLPLAEVWIREFGAGGVFFTRLLPVVRHLIGIPAGIAKMDFKTYSVATLVGAALWCTVLAWFGAKTIGDSPEILQSPDQLLAVMKAKLAWIVGAIALLAVLYGFVVWMRKRGDRAAA
jgi:membrane protein DedA with SNARE-associated domain